MALTAKNTGMNVTFIAESIRGAAPGSGQEYRVSDAIENVNLVGRNQGEVAYSVYDYDGQGTFFGADEYVLSFDYYLQRFGTSHPTANSIEYYANHRTSGNLKPLTFFVNGLWLKRYDTTRFVFFEIHRIFTFREGRTGEKLTALAKSDDHFAATLLTFNFGFQYIFF